MFGRASTKAWNGVFANVQKRMFSGRMSMNNDPHHHMHSKHKYTESMRQWHDHQRSAHLHRLMRLYGRDNVLKTNKNACNSINDNPIQNMKQFNVDGVQQQMVETRGY